MAKNRYELGRPRFEVVVAFLQPAVRARICGYPAGSDCLSDLTPRHLVRFAESGWLRKWGTDPAIREFMQGDVMLYGTWGFVREVEQFLSGRAGPIGGVGLILPELPEGELHLFIVGACRLPDED